MEPIIVDPKSWHYRMMDKMNTIDVFKTDMDTCYYLSCLVGSFLLLAFVGAVIVLLALPYPQIVAALVAHYSFWDWVAEADGFHSVGSIVFVAECGCILTWFVVAIVPKGFRWVFSYLPKRKKIKPKVKGPLRLMVDGWVDQYCVPIKIKGRPDYSNDDGAIL